MEEKWNAHSIYDLKRMRGEYGGFFEDNRPQVSRTYDGEEIIYCWIDTDWEGFYQNNLPDLFIQEYNAQCRIGWHGWNSEYSGAWLQSNFTTISKRIFSDNRGDIISIPVIFVVGDSIVINPDNPISYRFISELSFELTYPEFPDFEADKEEINIGESVNFSCSLQYPYEIVAWQFEGGIPSYHYGHFPPPIYYYTEGKYDVSLNISDIGGYCSNVKYDYISVSVPQNYEQILIEESTINIFPNPSNSNFGLFSKELLLSVRIMSIKGELIYYKDQINTYNHSIDLNPISPGLYIIQPTTQSGKTTTQKLIVY